jgi:hypothetical protein
MTNDQRMTKTQIPIGNWTLVVGTSQFLASAKTVSLTQRFNAGIPTLIVTLQLF